MAGSRAAGWVFGVALDCFAWLKCSRKRVSMVSNRINLGLVSLISFSIVFLLLAFTSSFWLLSEVFGVPCWVYPMRQDAVSSMRSMKPKASETT